MMQVQLKDVYFNGCAMLVNTLENRINFLCMLPHFISILKSPLISITTMQKHMPNVTAQRLFAL